MDENNQSIPLVPPAEPISPTPTIPPPPVKKSRTWIWIVVGVVGILFVCGIVAGILIFTGIRQVTTEKPLIEDILDQYMQAMVDKDIEAAYALFSPRAQRQVSISELEKLISGSTYKVFEGYLDISADQLKISTVVNSDQNVPQGRVATVSGTTSYSDGFSGTFDGTLEKVNGTWMIDGIYVNVPVDKLGP